MNCNFIITKGKRRGQPCGLRCVVRGADTTKCASHAGLDIILPPQPKCTRVLTAGLRKGQVCGRSARLHADELLCDNHIRIELYRGHSKQPVSTPVQPAPKPADKPEQVIELKAYLDGPEPATSKKLERQCQERCRQPATEVATKCLRSSGEASRPKNISEEKNVAENIAPKLPTGCKQIPTGCKQIPTGCKQISNNPKVQAIIDKRRGLCKSSS